MNQFQFNSLLRAVAYRLALLDPQLLDFFNKRSEPSREVQKFVAVGAKQGWTNIWAPPGGNRAREVRREFAN